MIAGSSLSACTSDSEGGDADARLRMSFAPSSDRGAVRVFERFGGSGEYATEVTTPGNKPLMAIRMDCEGPGAVVVQLKRKGTTGSAGGSIACDDPDDAPARVGAQDLGTDTVIEVKQTNAGARWSVAVDLYDEEIPSPG